MLKLLRSYQYIHKRKKSSSESEEQKNFSSSSQVGKYYTMKVHEIISEQQTDEGAGRFLFNLGRRISRLGAKGVSTGAKIGGAASLIGTAINGVLVCYQAIGLGSMVKIYIDKTDDNLKLLEAGKLSKEEFDSRRQADMAQLVGELVIWLGTAAIGKILLWIPNLFFKTFSFIPGMKSIAGLVNGLDTAKNAAMVYFLNTDTGREWLAKLLAWPILGTPLTGQTALGGGVLFLYYELKEAITGQKGDLAPGANDKYKKKTDGNKDVDDTSTGTTPGAPRSTKSGDDWDLI